MRITRREILKAGTLTGLASALPSVPRAWSASTDARTVRMAMQDLRSFDPVSSTATITYNHAFAIYDTLFALDASYTSQPQMVERWAVSDDKKTYTFKLRDGLGWHDGTPVTAADCVASIRRWAELRPGGQVIVERAKEISKRSDNTFVIALKEPLGLLIDILAAPALFMMREKDADLAPTDQVTANIGSGPFKFNHLLAKPGASFTYDRNEKYIPRSEPLSGLAGGKVVKIDRAVWENISDQQTGLAALQSGEIDYMGAPQDFIALIEKNPGLTVELVDTGGVDYFIRMNCLQKPFDNVKMRQAMLHLIDQDAFLAVMRPDPRYRKTVKSIFGNDNPYTNDANTAWFKKGGGPETAKLLLKEAGYNGETIVLLDATNSAWNHHPTMLLGHTMRQIGMNVEVRGMDWGQLAALQSNRSPISEGGWSIFVSGWENPALSHPVTCAYLAANGDKAWSGWPTNDEYEALRTKWVDVETLEERKQLAVKMQTLWWDFVGGVFLGQGFSPVAHSKRLSGLVSTPGFIVMWNMQKV